jgi:TonB family protein
MANRPDSDAASELPSELESLDRELSSIEIEERPSFGPELKAELKRAYAERPRRRYVPGIPRMAVAAGIAALLLASVSVPAARGSLVRFLRAVQQEAVGLLRPPQPVVLPEVVVEEPVQEVEEPVAADIEVTAPRVDLPDVEAPPVPSDVEPTELGMSFPEILDRRATQRQIEALYPDTLQEAGIGGVVKLLLWVEASGEVDWMQYVESSGVPGLDRAAILAAPSLRFRPARRNGIPVGTWVEFDVVFVPPNDRPSGTGVVYR